MLKITLPSLNIKMYHILISCAVKNKHHFYISLESLFLNIFVQCIYSQVIEER